MWKQIETSSQKVSGMYSSFLLLACFFSNDILNPNTELYNIKVRVLLPKKASHYPTPMRWTNLAFRCVSYNVSCSWKHICMCLYVFYYCFFIQIRHGRYLYHQKSSSSLVIYAQHSTAGMYYDLLIAKHLHCLSFCLFVFSLLQMMLQCSCPRVHPSAVCNCLCWVDHQNCWVKRFTHFEI